MKLIQFEALFIRDFKTDLWPFPLHNHNHYEFMYIRSGSGDHILNGKKTKYQLNDIFFLRPEDKHDFIIKEETHFSVIKFLPNVLKGGLNTNNTNFWDNLLQSVTREVQAQIHKSFDKSSLSNIKGLVEILISDWRDHSENVTELHINLLRSLLLLVEKAYRSVQKSELLDYGNSLLDRIQNYIHANIHYPEKITVKELSISFKMSESGFKALFKREMGISLREYISSLKLQQIKENLEFSSSTISEIAQDFRFTDSSHFYRFFLAHTGITPFKFRKEVKRSKSH